MTFPKLTSKAILSPMAGVTDVAFRTLCKKYGAGMTYTEFVSSAALVRDNKKTHELLVTDPSEKPVGVQLFGANEEEIVTAAKLVQDDFDVIDMNCGCPAHKVIKTGAGSAMLNDPERIGKLVKRVVEAVKKPVTVKIRAGIDDRNITAVDVAKAAEAAGAAAIAVHGRTQKQAYSGLADWDVVKAVKEAVAIPVIGNGDVFSAQGFKEKMEYSGCDYIMIARGAIGTPGIFQEINNLSKDLNYLNNSKNNINMNSIKTNNIQKNSENNSKSKEAYFLEYYNLAKRYKIPFTQIKAHAMHFTKGIKDGSKIREEITKATNKKEVLRLFNRLLIQKT